MWLIFSSGSLTIRLAWPLIYDSILQLPIKWKGLTCWLRRFEWPTLGTNFSKLSNSTPVKVCYLVVCRGLSSPAMRRLLRISCVDDSLCLFLLHSIYPVQSRAFLCCGFFYSFFSKGIILPPVFIALPFCIAFSVFFSLHCIHCLLRWLFETTHFA